MHAATVGHGKATRHPRPAGASRPSARAAQARTGRLAARAAPGRQARLGRPVNLRRDRGSLGPGALLRPALVRTLPARRPGRAAPSARRGQRTCFPTITRTGPSLTPEAGGGRVAAGRRRPALVARGGWAPRQAGHRLQVPKKSRGAAEGPAAVPRKKGPLGSRGFPGSTGRAPGGPKATS